MPVTAVNAPRGREQREGTMAKVALGVNIANNVLGLGLAIPKFLQERGAAQSELARAEAEERRRSEMFPLEKQLKQTQIDQNTEENRPLTEQEIKELKDTFDIPSVLMPRTLGEARGRQFMLSPKEKRALDQKDREIDIKEREISAKAAESAAKKEQKKELPANQVLNVNEGNAIPTTLTRISRTILENQDIFGPVEGRARGVNPYDTRAQKVSADLRTASQQFGRYMEGGVLRKEDEEKYRRMFPQLGDTSAVASEKLNIVNRILRDKQTSDLKALEAQGFDMTGLSLPPEIKFIDGLPYEKVEGGWRRLQ